MKTIVELFSSDILFNKYASLRNDFVEKEQNSVDNLHNVLKHQSVGRNLNRKKGIITQK